MKLIDSISGCSSSSSSRSNSDELKTAVRLVLNDMFPKGALDLLLFHTNSVYSSASRTGHSKPSAVTVPSNIIISDCKENIPGSAMEDEEEIVALKANILDLEQKLKAEAHLKRSAVKKREDMKLEMKDLQSDIAKIMEDSRKECTEREDLKASLLAHNYELTRTLSERSRQVSRLEDCLEVEKRANKVLSEEKAMLEKKITDLEFKIISIEHREPVELNNKLSHSQGLSTTKVVWSTVTKTKGDGHHIITLRGSGQIEVMDSIDPVDLNTDLWSEVQRSLQDAILNEVGQNDDFEITITGFTEGLVKYEIFAHGVSPENAKQTAIPFCDALKSGSIRDTITDILSDLYWKLEDYRASSEDKPNIECSEDYTIDPFEDHHVALMKSGKFEVWESLDRDTLDPLMWMEVKSTLEDAILHEVGRNDRLFDVTVTDFTEGWVTYVMHVYGYTRNEAKQAAAPFYDALKSGEIQNTLTNILSLTYIAPEVFMEPSEMSYDKDETLTIDDGGFGLGYYAEWHDRHEEYTERRDKGGHAVLGQRIRRKRRMSKKREMFQSSAFLIQRQMTSQRSSGIPRRIAAGSTSVATSLDWGSPRESSLIFF